MKKGNGLTMNGLMTHGILEEEEMEIDMVGMMMRTMMDMETGKLQQLLHESDRLKQSFNELEEIGKMELEYLGFLINEVFTLKMLRFLLIVLIYHTSCTA